MTVLEPPVLEPGLWGKLARENDATHAENGETLERIQAKINAILEQPEPDWMRAR
jgi:hypothetical protein